MRALIVALTLCTLSPTSHALCFLEHDPIVTLADDRLKERPDWRAELGQAGSSLDMQEELLTIFVGKLIERTNYFPRNFFSNKRPAKLSATLKTVEALLSFRAFMFELSKDVNRFNLERDSETSLAFSQLILETSLQTLRILRYTYFQDDMPLELPALDIAGNNGKVFLRQLDKAVVLMQELGLKSRKLKSKEKQARKFASMLVRYYPSLKWSQLSY